jgi:uncharacterized membrane protein
MMSKQSDHPPKKATAPDERHIFPSLERFNSFSDGVFSIAITLLVLELPVPPMDVAIWPALQEASHDFLGYLISFAFIGSIWLTHAGLTKVMRRGDTVSYGLNLLLLLFVALLPFSTSLMVTHMDAADIGTGVLLYGISILLASLTLSLLLFYVAREPGLAVDGIAEAQLRRIYGQRWSVITINGIALVLAFFAPRVALGLYLVMAGLLLAMPLLGGLRRHRRRTAVT